MLDDPTRAVVVAWRDPQRYLKDALAGLNEGQATFLACPSWTPEQWRMAFPTGLPKQRLMASPQLELLAGMPELEAVASHAGHLMVATGGSSGGIRFAQHNLDSLSAASGGYHAAFDGPPKGTLITLPPWHIAGFMQAYRADSGGYSWQVADWKALERGELPNGDFSNWQVSLVPTQLYRLLRRATTRAWLASFQCVLLGGAHPPKPLLDSARNAGIPLALSYGLTEAAATVAVVSTARFASGETQWAELLSHVGADADPESGALTLTSDALFSGYWPETPKRITTYATGDFGFVKGRQIQVKGRLDRLINCGGEKLDPGVIEPVALTCQGVSAVAVIGVPDSEWGQVAVLAYVTENTVDETTLTETTWRHWLKDRLPANHVPKRFVRLDALPRSHAGKVNYAALSIQVASALGQPTS